MGKLILILLGLLISVNCQDTTISSSEGNTSSDNLETVNFYLYTQNGPETLSREVIASLDHNRLTILLVHGELSGVNLDPNILNLTEAYVQRSDANVILADWKRQQSFNSNSDVYDAITTVGDAIGELIVSLSASGIDVKRVHLIGQSLGAHICGIAGRYVYRTDLDNDTIYRITALDPAGSIFEPILGFVRNAWALRSSDADVVDVTHTNAGFFGLRDNIGTVDFYVNGGLSQAACGNVNSRQQVQQAFVNICSRSFAAVLFELSLFSRQYLASTESNSCRDLVIYGDYLNATVRGTYYVRTEDDYPYTSIC